MKKSDFQKILQKYGEAFMFLNEIEVLIEGFLRKECGFNKLDENIANQILFKKSFGGKYELAKSKIKDEMLKKRIKSLIDKRNFLAHSWLLPYAIKDTDESFFGMANKLIIQKVDEKFFNNIIELSKEVIISFREGKI